MCYKEFKNFQFTTLNWSSGAAEYTRELVSLAEKIAQVLKPDFSISFGSGCDLAGNIKWAKSENCIGYFEYYTAVRKACFRGEKKAKITITAEFGFAYESDGTDGVCALVSGLPGKFTLCLQTGMGQLVDIYLTALPEQTDSIERTILS